MPDLLGPGWAYRPGPDVCPHPPEGLRAAQQIARGAVTHGCSVATAGLSELALASMVSEAMVSAGAVGVWTTTIVGVGENAKVCFPTHGPTDAATSERDVVLIDVHPITSEGWWGDYTRCVIVGDYFGVQDSFDMLLGKIQGAVDQGFKRTKLKVRPGWDLEMLRIVREAFPRHVFHIDCNSGYSLDDLPFFREVDKLGLAMIEQPLFHRDLHDHAELQAQLDTPICLDESITSLRDFELALRLNSCRYLNIKIGRVGGIATAVRLHDRAREAGIPCWVGGMLESGIGAGASVELAGLGNFTYPNDLFPSAFFYREDLTEPGLVLNPDCTFSLSTVPGTPYLPVMERVQARTIRRAILEA